MANIDQKCGGITIGDMKSNKAGLSIPYYAERYLRDSNVYLVGQIEQYVGGYGSGKSAYGFHVAQRFIDAGGLFFLVETESKTSALSMEANLGKERVATGRVRVIECETINQVKGDDEEFIKSWQGIISEIVHTIKKNKLEKVPIYILLDSILGAPSAESCKNIDESGVVAASTVHLRRASAVSEYMTKLCKDISGTNILLGFTNHGKDKINIGGMPSRGDPRTFPGGAALAFRCSLVLWFDRGGKDVKADTAGRDTRLSVYKNSFGDESRNINVAFQYDLLRDEKGDIILDEYSNPSRTVVWEWHEATGELIYSISDESGSMKIKIGSDARLIAKNVLKLLKTEDVREIGKTFERSEEAKQMLKMHARTNVSMHPELEFVKPGEA